MYVTRANKDYENDQTIHPILPSIVETMNTTLVQLLPRKFPRDLCAREKERKERKNGEKKKKKRKKKEKRSSKLRGGLTPLIFEGFSLT